MKVKDKNKKIMEWQDKFERSLNHYKERDEFLERESLYNGAHDVGMGNKSATCSWNICAELVESQTDNTIPMPLVTPKKQDEKHKRLARIIQDMIRCELDRLPAEELNDQDERNAKVDGLSISLVEWDNSIHTHDTVGDILQRCITARQFIPQEGVFDYRKMDYLFVTFDDTKERIKNRYGKDVETANLYKTVSDNKATSEELVTQIIAYYKNKKGGLGCFSWVGGTDTVLIDDDNYEARKQKVCAKCGKTQAMGEKVCICGCDEWISKDKEFEYLEKDITLSDGTVVPATSPVIDDDGEVVYEDYQEQVYDIDPQTGLNIPRMMYSFDEMGMPIMGEDGLPVGEPMMETKQRPAMEQTKIPYYYPKMYPISIRKNISKNNSVGGISDIDLIRDHQIEINKYLTKASEILNKAAIVIPVAEGHRLRLTDNTYQPVEMDAQTIATTRVLDLSVSDTKYDNAVNFQYTMAKSVLGITDTFQGKSDATAESGAAKQVQVSQSQGRQRSKKVMKHAAAADRYEMFFKYMLAYSDEPRHFTTKDLDGNDVDTIFNRYDFLEKDEFGNWYYDDGYTFSVDENYVDAHNKQQMLEDLRTDFGLGAYGSPDDPQTMLMYWKQKEAMGYPNSSRMVKEWQVRIEQQQMQQQQMMEQQMAMGGDQFGTTPQYVGGQMPQEGRTPSSKPITQRSIKL